MRCIFKTVAAMLRLSALSLLTISLLMACGEDGSHEETFVKTLGAAGLVIDLPSGGTLAVPAAALAADVDISVEDSVAPESTEFTTVGPFISLALLTSPSPSLQCSSCHILWVQRIKLPRYAS